MNVQWALPREESGDEIPSERLSAAISAAVDAARADGSDEDPPEIRVVLVDDPEIARLNESFRGKSGPTDVLSFRLEATPLPEDRDEGEIYISIPTARRQAEEAGIDLLEETVRLVIHGTLHLLGYDHEVCDERVRMERVERDALGRWERMVP